MWNCTACTYQNADPELLHCEMCHRSRRKSKQPSVQSSIASFASGKTNNSKRRKMNTADVAESKTSATTTATKKTTTSINSKKTFITSRQTTTETNLSILRPRMNDILQNVFGIDQLRPLQQQAVEGLLQRQSQLVLMATGSGKSLCFQLPAVVLGGTTIVVSPLVALLQDQVQALQLKHISAVALSSANSASVNTQIFERLIGGSGTKTQQKKSKQKQHQLVDNSPITLLYCTPEQVQTSRFRHMLQTLHQQKSFTALIIDESHCVSSWGHDFRPAYRQLNVLRQDYPNVPCLACTATATSHVVKDMKDILLLETTHIGSLDRPNIHYQVRYHQSTQQDLTDLVKFVQKQQHQHTINCSGLIYVHKRQDTVFLAQAIQKAMSLKVASYHGALSVSERTRIQSEWTKGDIPLVVCTLAFGMGVDLAHVRYVVHWSMPKSVEEFYQESGRAGRDGLPSQSLLYYNPSDARKFQFLIQQQTSNSKKDDRKKKEATMQRKLQALQTMVEYCTTAACRRAYLVRHFGGTPTRTQQCCDYCRNPKSVQAAIRNSAMQDNPTKLSTNKFGVDLDDEDDWQEPVHYDAGDLQIDGNTTADPFEAERPRPSFQKASQVLEKLEAMENQTNDKQTRKQRDWNKPSGRSKGAVIPEHWRRPAVVAAPPAAQRIQPPVEDAAARVKRLQRELAAVRAQRR